MLIKYCLLLKEIDYDLYFRSIELPRNVNTNKCVRTAKAEKRMKERLNQEVNKDFYFNEPYRFKYNYNIPICIFKGDCM